MVSDGEANVWDVVVVGAGIAGSATAYRLLESNPVLRVLIIDRAGLCAGTAGGLDPAQ